MSGQDPYFAGPAPAGPPYQQPLPAPPRPPARPPRQPSKWPMYLLIGLMGVGAVGGMALWVGTMTFGAKKATEVRDKLGRVQAEVALSNAARAEEVHRSQTDTYTTDVGALLQSGLAPQTDLTVRVPYADATRFCASAQLTGDDRVWYWDSRNPSAVEGVSCA